MIVLLGLWIGDHTVPALDIRVGAPQRPSQLEIDTSSINVLRTYLVFELFFGFRVQQSLRLETLIFKAQLLYSVFFRGYLELLVSNLLFK